MSHWFHRNPLKSTARLTFDLGLTSKTTGARRICNEAAAKRNKLLDIICDFNLSIDTVNEAAAQYLSTLHGFVFEPESNTDSGLRHALKFKWTNSLSLKGDKPTEQSDALFDLCSILINIAFWYSKHAAKISAKDKVTMDDAKSIHKCLRIAAGIFLAVKDKYAPKLVDKGLKGEDLDDRILEAYAHQCTAEAQEVTMARAIELEHPPSLVAGLAYETSRTFQNADLALASLEDKQVGKWRRYLKFKESCYMAYAYSYNGEQLLKEDKCGEAIASLQESLKEYKKAEESAAEYCKHPGPGMTIRPQQHLFFRKLGQHLPRILDKCNRENSLIYHHSVPSEIPRLELKASHGLANPEDFELPACHADWKEAYTGFDVSHVLLEQVKSKNDDGKTKKKEDNTPIAPVKEQPIYQSEKDPSNTSGCVIQ